MMWTIKQSKKIDKIGLDKWLTTKDANGYYPVLDKALEKCEFK